MIYQVRLNNKKIEMAKLILNNLEIKAKKTKI